jgi:glucose-6-phosphate 1-dehydrogenase
VWNAGHIERVEIVWEETVALEGRAGYSDHAGALRDMIQNHLLQLLCLVAMEPPARLDPDHLHDREVELLRAVQPPLPGQMAARTVRARYSAGRVDGVDVPAYATSRAWTRPAAPRRSPRSPCWSATCAGPGCRSRCAPARRSPTGAARSSSTSGPRPIRPFRGRPPRRPTCCGSAWPRPPGASRQSQRPRRSLPPGAGRVRALPGTAGAAAYGRLLLAVLQGDPTLSIRGGEAEECWRITEPILAAWAADAAPL